MERHDRIPEVALDWLRAGKGAAIATVIQTWGSAPRPVGAQLVISRDGEMMGSVSGGCVEGAVVVEALEALEQDRLRILEYGVSDDDAFAVGLACGGRIRILVEPLGGTHGWQEGLLADLVSARAERRAIAVETVLATGERRLVPPEQAGASLSERFRTDLSGFADPEEGVFHTVHNPPLRLIVVGAVHIAQPLAAMAKVVGYDTTIVDPRSAFMSDARFPGQTLISDWPDEAMRRLAPDARTAVVTLTHDPKLDDPALMVALPGEAFYVGALGSTRTHAKRVARLGEAGLTEAAMARLDAPVGLDIGAKSPAEIAVSILAAITERYRRPDSARPPVTVTRPAAQPTENA